MGRVLIINPYYLPGYRSGGPQRTVENLVDFFGKTNEVYILTQDHDFQNPVRYEGIHNNTWIDVSNAKVMYVSSEAFRWKALKKAYNEFNVIYSCGLFEQNSVSLLIIHRLSNRKDKKIYVAPMGVFSEGAFYNKSHIKKRLFISICKAAGGFNDITWSFTTEDEVLLAEKVLRKPLKKDNYIIAEDLPAKVDFGKYRKKNGNCKKKVGKLNLVYISRIPPKKNLLYALKLLNSEYDGQISYDIFGVKEDEKYWQECEDEVRNLPGNIRVRYCGELMPGQVMDTFSIYDAFLFPTKGENYGHIIYEALCAGCIPIISDQTPWSDACIMRHSLYDSVGFAEDIKKLLNMNTPEIISAKSRCIEFAESFYIKSTENTGYHRVFDQSVK